MNGLSKKQIIILFLVLLFAFFWTYKRHFNYPYPYHHDEWQHIGISKQIILEGYNKEFNPFLGTASDHADLEPGFHFFLAGFFKLTGLDLILNYKYLAGVFACIALLSIFLCLYEKTKNYFLSLSAALIFLFITTNVNILGKEFFVPLSMAASFMFFMVFLLDKSINLNDKSIFAVLLLVVFIVFTIHPPSAIMFLLPAAFEIFKIRHFLDKKQLFLIIPFILICFLLLWKGDLINTKKYLFDLFYFEKGWGKLEIAYFIPFLYGLIPTLLGIYGLFSKFEKFRFFGISLFISLMVTAIFNIFEFTVLLPYSRAVHYAMLFMVVFTAVGIEKLGRNSWLFKYFLLALAIGSMAFPMYGKDIEFREYSQKVIYESDYKALIWIKENFGINNTIITPYFMTSSVYPVAENKVIALIPAQMGGGLIEENLNFYDYSCEIKKEIAIKSNANLIMSRNPINCGFITLVYSNSTLVYLIEPI